jgi:hypothetical protein
MKQIKLEIFERLNLGNGRHFTARFNGRNVFSIRKNFGCFSKPMIEFLRIDDESSVAMSTDGESWYFAILPMDSSIRGYKIQNLGYEGISVLAFSTKSYLARGIPEGTYEIGDPIFQNGIDWYLCERVGE